MSASSDPALDLAGLRRLLARVGRLLELPEDELTTPRPEVSSWSVGQHLFHLVLAGDLSLRNVKSLVARRGRLIRDFEQRDEEGLAILRRGRIPRGVAPAPRFVTPPPRLDLDVLRDLFADVSKALDEIEADPEGLASAPQGIPHQLLGDLDAREWVRFARVHTAHHLAICRDLRASAGAR